MEKDTKQPAPSRQQDRTSSKQPWRKPLKIAGITVASILGLFLLLCTLIVWILTPARLTPMVKDVANANLNATLDVKRVELSFWSTFPRMTLEVDSLSINSAKALADLPDELRSSLPADVDSLLSLRSFHAGVNVPKLLFGHISLHHVAFDGLNVNLIKVDSIHSNFNIIPPSEPSTNDEPKELNLPSISIDHFLISNALPIRWQSIPDSLHVEVAIHTVDLCDNNTSAPRYRIEVSGNAGLPILEQYNLRDITLGADGGLHWESNRPLALAVDDFTIAIDRYALNFSTDVDFTHSPTIKSFKAKTRPIALSDLLRHVPSEDASLTEPITTDLAATIAMQLTQPWNLADTTALPSLDASLNIPDGKLQYNNHTIDRLGADIYAKIIGTDIEASTIDIKKLRASGEGIDIDFRGSVTSPIDDPYIDGHLIGNIDINSLPSEILALIPGNIAGRLDSELKFRLALSDLDANRFHRIQARGNLNLHDFRFATDSLAANMHTATLRFGTSSEFVKHGHKIDSLLTLSLKIDTLWASMAGMMVQAKEFKAGAGTANRASSTDSTEINPFGFTISVNRLRLDSPSDTLRAAIYDGRISGALRRYNGDAKMPQIDLGVDMDGLRFGQALTRIGLRKANAHINLHMRPKPDFAHRQHPTQPDTNRRHRPRSAADSLRFAQNKGNDINMRLDSATSAWLRRWDFSGHVKAAYGSLATPYFPLRNRLRNIDFTFTADSMQLTNLRYRAGQSDFLINGTISNLRRALTSRRANTLNLDLSVMSDTINVNEIVKALSAGGTIAEKVDSTLVWNENTDNEVAEEQMADMAEDAPFSAFLVPRNIDAAFMMRAKHILYSDLELSDFNGNLLVYDGAVNLRDLSAHTDIGAIDVNALYSAPDTTDIQFGLGLTVSDFRLDKLSSVIPAIDSIMPALRDFAGVVNASVAVTTGLYPNMDIDIPSLRAAVNIEGDSLVLIDPATYRTIGKWLLFHEKEKNVIDHMAVEVVIQDSNLELYPFMFDIDRYRFGVMGTNDLAMNLNYHVSVLQSPIPFKFGVNVKGTPDKMKIRLGRAKFKEKMAAERKVIADNTRINIVEQINSAFRKGISKARMGRLNFRDAANSVVNAMGTLAGTGTHTGTPSVPPALQLVDEDTPTVVDTLLMISEGMLPNPSYSRYPIKPGR